MSRAKWHQMAHAVGASARGSLISNQRTKPDGRTVRSLRGVIVTRHGIVEVGTWRHSDAPRGDETFLRLVHAGRMHYRATDRAFSARGLAALAGRFAREIAGGAR